MILLKTSGATIAKVVEHAKHALHRRPSVERGDLILISQTEASLRAGELPVQYSMEFVRCYPDVDSESIRLWGRRWPLIIEGKNFRRLKKPFRMSEVRVSNKHYGRGGPICNVDPEDEQYLRDHGYLEMECEGRAYLAANPPSRGAAQSTRRLDSPFVEL